MSLGNADTDADAVVGVPVDLNPFVDIQFPLQNKQW